MAEQDPDERSRELKRETDELAREARKVQERIDETRQDWERKRADDSVPGAVPPQADEDDEADQSDEA